MEFFYKQQLYKRVDQMGLGHQYFKPIKTEKKSVTKKVGIPYGFLVFWFSSFAIFGFPKWKNKFEYFR